VEPALRAASVREAEEEAEGSYRSQACSGVVAEAGVEVVGVLGELAEAAEDRASASLSSDRR
jgi:hypothetical protein